MKAYRKLGQSATNIAAEYELDPEVVAEVLALAEEQCAFVDLYVADYQAELDRQFAVYEPTPAALRIQRLVAARPAQAPQAES